MAYESRFSLDDFELYRVARAFRIEIYKLIRKLPPEERYCLANQMRRAAVSITNNIAEGHGRWYFQENARFCRIARGSVGEVIDDLNVCIDERYSDARSTEDIKAKALELIARINSYIAYLNRSRQGNSDAP